MRERQPLRRLNTYDSTGKTDLEDVDQKGRYVNLMSYLTPARQMELQEAIQAPASSIGR